MVQIFNIDDLSTEIVTTSNNLLNTSNQLLNKITDLYTKNITFEENVTVSGDLTVNGTTVAINTDAYSTEILQIANDSENTAPLLKIDDNSSTSVRNIIQLNKNNDSIFSIDNSGKLNIQGTNPTIKILHTNSDGNAIISLREVNDNYGYDIAYIGKNDNKLYIKCYNNSATARTDMTFVRSNGNVGIGTTNPTEKLEVDGNLKANGGIFGGQISLPYHNLDGTKSGIGLNANFTEWGIYVLPGTTGPGISMGGNPACNGYGFTSTSIRLRTNSNDGCGLIYETSDEECKFSVRGSDGLGYLKGGLVSESNVTVKGGILNVHNTATGFENNMQPGSLIIGDPFLDYGHESSTSSTNMAGMMLNCKDKTEIAVHDAGMRVVSLMAYESDNKIIIGRDMGWGAIGSIEMKSDLTLRSKYEDTNIGINLGTPYSSTAPNKVSIVAVAKTNHSRSDLHFCLDNTANNSSQYKADPGVNSRMVIQSGGNVGIGTTNPTEKLDIAGKLKLSGGIIINETVGTTRSSTNGTIVLNHENSGGHSSVVFTSRANRGSDYGYISYQDDLYNRSGYEISLLEIGTQNDGPGGVGDYIAIMPSAYCGIGTRTPTEKLHVEGRIRATGGVTNFTGSHNCKSNTIDLYDDKYIGYIVSSSKKYSSINSTYHKDNIKQNINKEKNDCLPYVELTSKENDKKAFGIIYKIENETDTERNQDNGGFITTDSKGSYDRRIVVSGCGEGFLWVSDFNGPIETGDLISSSPIPGIGMKQDDDLLRSYTVAKITMDCDFNPAYIPVKVLQSSNYDIEYETTSNIVNTSNYEVEFITSSNTTFTSNLTTEYTTEVKIVNTSNVEKYFKDENGEYIYVNQLDDKGNIIYDYEYEMKYVRLDGTITDENEYTNGSNVYRMALVGGCYKCS